MCVYIYIYPNRVCARGMIFSVSLPTQTTTHLVRKQQKGIFLFPWPANEIANSVYPIRLFLYVCVCCFSTACFPKSTPIVSILSSSFFVFPLFCPFSKTKNNFFLFSFPHSVSLGFVLVHRLLRRFSRRRARDQSQIVNLFALGC